MALGLVSGFVGGIVPALRARKVNIVASLTGVSASGFGRRDRLFRRGFTVVQAGAAVILTVGAILTFKTLTSLEALDLGQNWTDVAVVRFGLGRAGLVGANVAGVHDELVDSAESVRGVVAAAIASHQMIESRDRRFVEVVSGDARAMASILQIAGDYSQVMGIPIVEGRALIRTDVLGVVVNQTLANKLWKGVSPIGRFLYVGGRREPLTVVGLSRDTRTIDQGAGRDSECYTLFAQRAPEPPGPPLVSVLVARCGSSCREAMAMLHQNLVRRPYTVVYAASLGAETLHRAQQPARIRAFLWMAYAVMAIGIAVIGVVALVGYVVTQRRFEIGVRLAMGSTRIQAVWLAAREGVVFACLGSLLGAVGSRWLDVAFRGLLLGVEGSDWLTVVQACVAALGCSTVAAFIPAFRVSGSEPLELLRRV